MTFAEFELQLFATVRGATPGSGSLPQMQARRVLTRRERGVGALRERMSPLFDAWTGPDLALVEAFLASPEGGCWADLPGGVPGAPLIEEALAAWAIERGLVSEAVAVACVVDAGARLLAMGKPGPRCFQRVGDAWVAVVDDAITYVRGPRIVRRRRDDVGDPA